MIDAFIKSWSERFSALGLDDQMDDATPPIRADFDPCVPLLISHSHDKTAQHFFRTCVSQRVGINWIKADRLSSTALLDGALSLISHSCGIYLRDFSESQANRFACAAIRSMLLKHANTIAPNLASSNWCKPFHVQRIASYLSRFRSVHVPETWMATSPPETGRLVVKNVSSSPAYVFDGSVKEADSEGGMPYLFQRRIQGYELRVHVIDHLCVAVAFRALGVDYRRDGYTKMQEAILSHEQYQACVHIASCEGLRFCGIDMIVRDKDSYVIEANPMPGYHGFERDGLRECLITNALYRAMAEPLNATSATFNRV